MKNKIVEWIKNKSNLPYVILFILGITLASYEYSFLSAVIGFGIIILFSLLAGFIINKLIK